MGTGPSAHFSVLNSVYRLVQTSSVCGMKVGDGNKNYNDGNDKVFILTS